MELVKQQKIPNGWITKSLSNLTTISRGGSPRPIQSYITEDNDGYNWLKIGDIDLGAKYIYSTSQKIKKEGLHKTTLVKTGDFILSNSMSYGRPYIMQIDACIHDGWLALRNIKTELISKDYLYYLLSTNKIQNTFISISAGSGVQNLKKETVSDVLVNIPTVPEQQQIVSILETWDKYLENIDKKIKVKKNIKKSLAIQLFSNKIRFKSYNDKLNKTKLSDVCDYLNGKSYENEVVHNGKYFLVTLNSLDINGKLKRYHKTINQKDNSLNKGDLIMILSDIAHGYFLGLTAVIPEDDKYVLNQRIGALKPKINVNSHFLSFLINTNQTYFNRSGQGSSQQNLSKGDVMSFSFLLPSLNEQKEISNILLAAENEIDQLEEQKKLVMEQKKYLLNNLITGTIRLPKFKQ